MLTRLAVDNWFTLRRFELRPARLAVVLPTPGLDPTDPLDVLEVVQRFVLEGRHATRMFPRRSLANLKFYEQSFTLELAGPGGRFRYELLIEQDRRRDTGARALTESLWHDETCLVSYHCGEPIPDDSACNPDPWETRLPRTPASESAIGRLAEAHDPRFAAFQRQLARIHLSHRVPDETLEETAERELATRSMHLAREALRDPEATVAVVLPDELGADELAAWLAHTTDAALAGRGGQLLLTSKRRALLEPFTSGRA
jgi:hypothetical protein